MPMPMIIGEIRRYLRDNNSIRVSRALRDTAYRALQIRNKIANTNFEEPSVDDIAKEMEVNRDQVVMALDAIQDPISLFEPVYHDGGDAIFVMDQVKDDKNADEIWLESIALKEAIRRLSEREKIIIDMRFFKGKTQMEVSEELGISQAQVSRLEKSAIKNMKRMYV